MEIIIYLAVLCGLILLIIAIAALCCSDIDAAIVFGCITAMVLVIAGIMYYMIMPSGETDIKYAKYVIDNKSAMTSDFIWITKKECRYNRYRADDVCEELYAKPIKQTTIDKIEPGQ